MSAPTAKWLARAALYRQFASTAPVDLDWSDEAACAMFEYESRGVGAPPSDGGDGVFAGARLNGYAVGKRWLDWQVEQWRAQLWALELPVAELYADRTLPWDFLDSALPPYFVALFHRHEGDHEPTYQWSLRAAPQMNRLRTAIAPVGGG